MRVEAETRRFSGSPVTAVFDDSSTTASAYDHVIVQQPDDQDGNGRDDEAIPSPIWILE